MKIGTVIKKELMDGIRNYRFLIIASAYLFFAIFNPVMTKYVLPGLLTKEYPNMPEELLAEMISADQLSSITSYLSSVFEVGMLVMVFVLCGIIAQEISERTFILPASTGKRYRDLVMGKFVVYGTALMLISTLSVAINYIYSSVLFGWDMVSLASVMRAGVLQGLYMVFILSLLMLVGALVKKSLVTGILVLIPAYALGFIGNLLGIRAFLPSALIEQANLFEAASSVGMYKAIGSTLIIVVVLIALTGIRLNKTEMARG